MATLKVPQTKTAGLWTFLLRYGGYIILLGIILFFAVASPTNRDGVSIFITPNNILNILKQVSGLAVVAFGLSTVVMGGGTDVISGGIDLSIAATLALVIAVDAVLIVAGVPVVLALFTGLLAALLVGLANAFLIITVGLAPLLATLAMMFTLQGAELIITQNRFVSFNNPVIRFVSEGSVLGLPTMIVVLIVSFLFFYLLLHRTPFGKHVQAIGGSHEAAHTSAIPVKTYTTLTYVLAGFAASIAAVLMMSRLSGSAPGLANNLLLDVVLATYISAAFSPRWVVNIPGTLLGALFVWVLTNGFTLLAIPSYWVHAVKGVLVLVVVSSASLQEKRVS